MPVKHQFQSAKTDGADATQVQPSNWNANHSGNAMPAIVVAASNSSAEDKLNADYVCDGTADDVELAAALAALTAGGHLIACPGAYAISASLAYTLNKKLLITAFGATFNVAAGVTGLRISQGNVSAAGVRIEGLEVDGGSLGTNIGIDLSDTNNAELVGVMIENCNVGLRLHSNAAGGFVEGTAASDVLIRGCTTGVQFTLTSGTGSFAQTVMRGLKITGCTTGISAVNGAILQRSHIQATVWIDTGQTAVSLDCNVEDSFFYLGIEGAAASTGNTGLLIGTNATNTDQAFFFLLFTGTIATQANFNNKNLHYWSGGSQIVQSTGLSVLGYKRHGDATDRIRFEGLTAGGRIQLGNGASLDVNLYRSAANVLSSDDKVDPASLNLQTKAGAPVDADVTGGAADGDVIADSSGKALYVRLGGVWVPLGIAAFSRGGTVLTPTAAINVIVWRAPYACTVTAVKGYRVGGTGATVNARKNGASNHLASDLSLTSADTWMDGGAVQNTAYAAGDKLEIMVVTVAGSPTQVAVQVDYTRP